MPDVVVGSFLPESLVEHVDLSVDYLDAGSDGSIDLVPFGVPEVQVADPRPVDKSVLLAMPVCQPL